MVYNQCHQRVHPFCGNCNRNVECDYLKKARNKFNAKYLVDSGCGRLCAVGVLSVMELMLVVVTGSWLFWIPLFIFLFVVGWLSLVLQWQNQSWWSVLHEYAKWHHCLGSSTKWPSFLSSFHFVNLCIHFQIRKLWLLSIIGLSGAFYFSHC